MSNNMQTARHETRDTKEPFFQSRFSLLKTLRQHARSVASRIARHASRSIPLLIVASLAHADALIDPTRPAFAPTKSSVTVRSVDPTSRLTAIFQSGERRVAVLDGRVVKAGDRVGDILIQEIMADSVRFTRAGRVEFARLPKQAASVRSDSRKESIRQESSP